MTIRVTVGSASAGALAGLQTSSARLAALQEQLSTGNQITKPSDDPAGTVKALELRGELKRNAQYARSSADATGWLSVADSTYGQITDLMQRARTLTTQGLNTGASTGASATAIANEISSIRDSIVTLANTSYNGQPVFGGTTAYGGTGPAAPFVLADPTDPTSAVLYKGNTGLGSEINRTIGDQNTIQINQDGTTAFGTTSSGGGLFKLLDDIVTNLKAQPPGSPAGGTVTDPLKSLDDQITRLSSARSASGAALARVTAAQTTGATDMVSLKTNLSQIQDIDLAQVAVAMNTAQVVYQASLQTTANIRQLSLLNFLK